MFRRLAAAPRLVRATWACLGLLCALALWDGLWALAFVAAATFALSVAPLLLAARAGVRLPGSFLGAILLFLVATLILGERFAFYHRFWWWDLLMHGGSAAGMGLLGFLFILMLFDGDRYAAPPWAMAFLGFCIAMTAGALWEILEFGLDQAFGFNTQKSGLPDTMSDLIVNTLGATLGAGCGYLYLTGRGSAGLTAPVRAFIRRNRHVFRKSRR